MTGRDARRRFLVPVLFATALGASSPVLAQSAPQPAPDRSTAPEPDYLDDRSDAKAVIRSLYNAVNRKELVRAWSYFRDEPGRPSFASFAKGYADTASVEVKLGAATGDAGAGSRYFSVPVAIRSVDTGGKTSVFAGCYQLRLVQPAAQIEPPFHPLGIVRGRLERTDKPFTDAAGRCSADGL